MSRSRATRKPGKLAELVEKIKELLIPTPLPVPVPVPVRKT
jgi:hypothetical protein